MKYEVVRHHDLIDSHMDTTIMVFEGETAREDAELYAKACNAELERCYHVADLRGGDTSIPVPVHQLDNAVSVCCRWDEYHYYTQAMTAPVGDAAALEKAREVMEQAKASVMASHHDAAGDPLFGLDPSPYEEMATGATFTKPVRHREAVRSEHKLAQC